MKKSDLTISCMSSIKTFLTVINILHTHTKSRKKLLIFHKNHVSINRPKTCTHGKLIFQKRTTSYQRNTFNRKYITTSKPIETSTTRVTSFGNHRRRKPVSEDKQERRKLPTSIQRVKEEKNGNTFYIKLCPLL